MIATRGHGTAAEGADRGRHVRGGIPPLPRRRRGPGHGPAAPATSGTTAAFEPRELRVPLGVRKKCVLETRTGDRAEVAEVQPRALAACAYSAVSVVALISRLSVQSTVGTPARTYAPSGCAA